jgi:hypothetical protein
MEELYTYLAGIVMSFFFAYFPKVETWYSALDGKYKRLVLLGFCVVVAAAYFALSCSSLAGKFGIVTPCTGDAAWDAVIILVKMFIGSQAAYTFLPSGKK